MFDEKKVAVKSYDFNRKSLQSDKDLVVRADKNWGQDFKTLMKYVFMRYAS